MQKWVVLQVVVRPLAIWMMAHVAMVGLKSMGTKLDVSEGSSPRAPPAGISAPRVVLFSPKHRVLLGKNKTQTLFPPMLTSLMPRALRLEANEMNARLLIWLGAWPTESLLSRPSWP